MLTDEVASAIAKLFDAGRGPSHDELTRLFDRAGLSDADPLGRSTDPVGKMKRVRAVLYSAVDTDPTAGERLVGALLAAFRAGGGFRPGSDAYPGDDTVAQLRAAFARAGYELDPEGALYPRALDRLSGGDLTDALEAYVRRARAGSLDAALLVGSSKDLVEAVARHVLVELTGSYPERESFPVTLYHAWDRLNLACPTPTLSDGLDKDPERALEQVVWLLGVVVNRLRNAEGTGHGRPFPTTVGNDRALLAAEAMGVVSQLMLDELREQR